VELRTRRDDALLVHVEARRMPFAAPTQTQLVLTLGFHNPGVAEGGNHCVSGVRSFRAPRGKDLLFS
jgi:hypothetical protein